MCNENLGPTATWLAMFKVEDAKKAINQNQAISENCGSRPTIIGTCRVQSKPLMQVEFSLLEEENEEAARWQCHYQSDCFWADCCSYNMIYFIRHDPNSMRFYSFDLEGYAHSRKAVPCQHAASSRGNFVLGPLVSGIDGTSLRRVGTVRYQSCER